MFEEDESTSGSGPVVQLPACAKMVINDQFGDFIGRFLQQYFKVYDTDNREQLGKNIFLWKISLLEGIRISRLDLFLAKVHFSLKFNFSFWLSHYFDKIF